MAEAKTRTRKKKTPETCVVVCKTEIGHDLVLRSNPTDEEVRSFVAENTKRFQNGQPAGPSGLAPYKILSATRFDSEEAYLVSGDGAEIDVSELTP